VCTSGEGGAYGACPGGILGLGVPVYDPNSHFCLQLEDRGPILYHRVDNEWVAIWGWWVDDELPSGCVTLFLGKDGNLYVYGAESFPGAKDAPILRQTSFSTSSDSSLQLQADGDLVIYPEGEHG
jgi:hypothetical protein